jgi:hypothetical protein
MNDLSSGYDSELSNLIKIRLVNSLNIGPSVNLDIVLQVSNY